MTKLCQLTDCDCNVDGFCTDWFAHIVPRIGMLTIQDTGDCMNYNPVDKEDDSGAPFWD